MPKRSFALILLCFITTAPIFGQCGVNILNTNYADSLHILCGTSVTLTSDSNTHGFHFNDFNNGQLGQGWTATAQANFTNPCGPGSGSGSTHLWFDATSAAPRTLRSPSYNFPCGGQVCFELRYAFQGWIWPCEGPDFPNEGVSFEYTLNNGATWDSLHYFMPNQYGSLNSYSPGSGDFTAWATYCFTLPAAASSNAVSFRWHQYASTSATHDHWGLDSITFTNYCAGSSFSSSILWSTGDTGMAITTPNIYNTTNYWVRRINQSTFSGVTSIDTCFDSVVVVPSNFNVQLVVDSIISCHGFSDGGLSTIVTNGSGNHTYLWSTGDTTSILDSLTPGSYSVTTTDSTGCISSASTTLVDPLPLSTTITPVNVACSADSNGSFQAISTGGGGDVFGNYGYYYYFDSALIGFSFNNNLFVYNQNDLDTGEYILKVLGIGGCELLDTFYIGYDDVSPVWPYSDTTYWCGSWNSPLVLDAGNPGATFAWSNGSFSQTTSVSVVGQYSVTITNGACQTIGTTQVQKVFAPWPAMTLPDTTILCTGSQLTLDAGNTGSSFSWNTGETSQSIVTDSAGLYIVTITTPAGCEKRDTALVIEDPCSGIEVTDAQAIQVYPNPANRNLTVLSKNTSIEVIKLYSATGQLLFSRDGIGLLQTDIQVANFSSGTYILEVETSAQGRYRERIVIQ